MAITKLDNDNRELREYEDNPEYNIRHGFSPNRIMFLRSRGVDHDSFMKRDFEFSMTDSLCKISTDIPRVIAKNIPVKKQLRVFDSLVEKPLSGNPVICISSFPTDLRAKQTALYLLNRAVDCYNTTTSRRVKSKSAPLWHRVYSNYGDNLLQAQTKQQDSQSPCYLVISNLDENSSNVKLEKVRDLLDCYSDIPRIVVTTAIDPLTFFATKFHYMLTAGLYLGPGARNVSL